MNAAIIGLIVLAIVFFMMSSSGTNALAPDNGADNRIS